MSGQAPTVRYVVPVPERIGRCNGDSADVSAMLGARALADHDGHEQGAVLGVEKVGGSYGVELYAVIIAITERDQ